jgi:two-component system invasion response regulator UvrY
LAVSREGHEPRDAPRLVPFDGGFVVNVFIVDDSVIASRMVQQLLAAYPDVVIVGESRSAEDGFALIDALAPDLVVMDWSMPGMSGVEATAELRRRRPELRVVGFTSTSDPSVHEAFMAAGATAVFAKSEAMALREYLVAAAAVG